MIDNRANILMRSSSPFSLAQVLKLIAIDVAVYRQSPGMFLEPY